MRGSEEGRNQITAIEERLEADEKKMAAVSPPVFLNLAKAAVRLLFFSDVHMCSHVGIHRSASRHTNT